MEKFIVSARKYRPQTFASVIGQQHITTTLKNAIKNDTLAHAFLFCGPRGVGKTTCARILAKTINCDNRRPDGEACNQCPSCLSFNKGTSMNIHELDAASNNGVDDIRELVTQVRFAPQEGKYKVYIIDEVHMLSQQAFNAFLKTLEEPPAYAKFILATTEKHKIIPTILSRCQIFDFKRITNADTVEHLQHIALQESIAAEKSALQLIAQKSEGCLRDSLSLLDKIVSFTQAQLTYQNTLEHLNLLDDDYHFRILDCLLKQDLPSALLLYDEINRKGFEGNVLLEGFAAFLRNLMVSRDQRAAALLEVLEGMQERYALAAQTTSLGFLVTALGVVSEAALQYREVHNKRLHVELCLIRLCYLQNAIELAVDSGGKVVARRAIQGPVALRKKAVSPLQAKTPAAPAKLTIEQLSTIPPAAEPEPPYPPGRQQAAEPTAPPRQDPGTPKATLLERLRNDKKLGGPDTEPEAVREPSMEEVKEIWHAYIEGMREKQKHITVSNMQAAGLHLENQTLVVSCDNVLGAKALETEATPLTDLLRKRFNNYAVTLVIRLENNGSEPATSPEPKHLSTAERYRLMAEQYPMVEEFKQRLKLELGY
jgi:DNA polymerase-3 subunit gamma/tau